MSDRFGLLVEKIKEKNITCDFDLLEKAYGFALTAHGDQRRESGEPFIVHPIEVAIILAELELDCTSIIAALLHDIIEDTKCTYERIKEQFGEDVVSLVDGVTKLGQIQYSTKVEQQAENFRKMFLAMAKDIRVIMIKLADRLHNMRTLSYMPAEKQLEKARESLEIYAPLAHRLGIFRIKWELDDISLRYIDPKGYYELVEGAQKEKEREFLNQIIQTLTEKIKELNIEYHIEGRPKILQHIQ